MLVKNITKEWQIAAKYDSYNPNTKIAESDINDKNDLAFSTLGVGFHNYSFDNIRLSLWYELNTTTTKDKVVTTDPIDNLLTLRFQFKF
jgi:phosphate-selective porin